jgi:hypothetical protein
MVGDEGPHRILENEAHSDRVDSIQWANHGLRFISGSKDGTAQIWHFERQRWCSLQLLMSTKLPGWVDWIEIVPDVTLIVILVTFVNQKLTCNMITWVDVVLLLYVYVYARCQYHSCACDCLSLLLTAHARVGCWGSHVLYTWWHSHGSQCAIWGQNVGDRILPSSWYESKIWASYIKRAWRCSMGLASWISESLGSGLWLMLQGSRARGWQQAEAQGFDGVMGLEWQVGHHCSQWQYTQGLEFCNWWVWCYGCWCRFENEAENTTLLLLQLCKLLVVWYVFPELYYLKYLFLWTWLT